MAGNEKSSFVVVANRLPVDRVTESDDEEEWRTAPGGLVSALESVLRKQDGSWIGWPGADLDGYRPFEVDGLQLQPIPLSEAEVELYYEGMSNGTLWPLYHDLVAKPSFHREWWDAYVAVNRRFAEAAAEKAKRDATVWVHDYQLQLGARACCARCGPTCASASSCTSPFRLRSCSGSCPGGTRSSAACSAPTWSASNGPAVPRTSPDWSAAAWATRPTAIASSWTATGWSRPARIHLRRRRPAGVTGATRTAVAKRATELREELGDPRHVLLGVDRLDYTKGIRQRLRAFGELIVDGQTSVGARQSSSRWRRRVENGSRSTSRFATTSNGGSGGSTVSSAGSAGRRSTTCMPPSHGKKWSRCFAPRTSWSLRPSPTA